MSYAICHISYDALALLFSSVILHNKILFFWTKKNKKVYTYTENSVCTSAIVRNGTIFFSNEIFYVYLYINIIFCMSVYAHMDMDISRKYKINDVVYELLCIYPK